MVNEFKITVKQHLILLTPLIILNSILFLGCQYILKIPLTSSAFIITISIFFFIDTLPTLILHIQYWIKNKRCQLVIDTKSEIIQYKEGISIKSIYHFDQIKSLQFYHSYANGTGWHSFGQYRFYRIIFNNDYELVITCLVVNDIEKTIPVLLRINEEKHLKVIAYL